MNKLEALPSLYDKTLNVLETIPPCCHVLGMFKSLFKTTSSAGFSSRGSYPHLNMAKRNVAIDSKSSEDVLYVFMTFLRSHVANLISAF
jgi:hypothetical protein